MSDPGEDQPPEARTQTAKALALVVVVAAIAVVVLRHTGPSTPATVAVGHPATTTTTTVPAERTRPPRPRSTTTTLPLPAPADITVEVFNGLQSGLLATDLSARLRSDGYRLLPADNTSVPTSTSVIYVVRRAYTPEAKALAATLGLEPGAVRFEHGLPAAAPIPAGFRTGSDLIVVIGTSLEALASVPPPATTTTATAATTTTTASAPTTTAVTTTAPPAST